MHNLTDNMIISDWLEMFGFSFIHLNYYLYNCVVCYNISDSEHRNISLKPQLFTEEQSKLIVEKLEKDLFENSHLKVSEYFDFHLGQKIQKMIDDFNFPPLLNSDVMSEFKIYGISHYFIFQFQKHIVSLSVHFNSSITNDIIQSSIFNYLFLHCDQKFDCRKIQSHLATEFT